MTIEPYNYNDEPSGRTDTLIQAIEKIERLEKQLKIAVEALESYQEDRWAYEDTYYNYPPELVGGWVWAERALKQIKELGK